MEALLVKTRGKSSPQGKQRVYFACHPDDFGVYFNSISDEVLKVTDCAVFYRDTAKQYEKSELLSYISDMQLIIVPVTGRLLTDPNDAMDMKIPFAFENHIPVLPLMQDSSLVELYAKRFGDLQFLDKNKHDDTAIPYEKKFEDYLKSVLVGDELAKKVRAAFDAYIFLSYRKKDRKYAKELMRLIHKNGFCRDIAIWYDEYLTPGEDFNNEISDAMKKSILFTLAVTPNLVNEPNYVMTHEYPDANKLGKKVLPIEMAETDKAELKKYYKDIPDCIDAHDECGLSDAILSALENLALRENDADPEHNFFIGLAYLAGIDVEVDNDRALALITSSAESGLPEAMEKLVMMYRTGEGVKRDYFAAVGWQRKLAEKRKGIFLADGNDDNALGMTIAYWHLGNDLKALGKLAEAKEAYRTMREMLDMVKAWWKDRYVSISYHMLGNIAAAEGDVAEAKEYYEKGLKIRLELAKKPGTPDSYDDLAISYTKLGRLLPDRSMLETAYKIWERLSSACPQVSIYIRRRDFVKQCIAELG